MYSRVIRTVAPHLIALTFRIYVYIPAALNHHHATMRPHAAAAASDHHRVYLLRRCSTRSTKPQFKARDNRVFIIRSAWRRGKCVCARCASSRARLLCRESRQTQMLVIIAPREYFAAARQSVYSYLKRD